MLRWLVPRRPRASESDQLHMSTKPILKTRSSTLSSTSNASKQETPVLQPPLQQEPQLPLLQLPNELLYEITTHLDPLSRVAFKKTCRGSYHALSQYPSLTGNCAVICGDEFMKFFFFQPRKFQVRHLQIHEPFISVGLLAQTVLIHSTRRRRFMLDIDMMVGPQLYGEVPQKLC